MKNKAKNKYLVIIVIVLIISLMITLMLIQNKNNKNDLIDSKLYNIWNPHGATIEKDGNLVNYDDYDKEGYLIISKETAARCTRDVSTADNCNDYEYSGTREYIDVISNDKYLSGKYFYEINEDDELRLIKENTDGSRIIYTYGHPQG